MLRSGVAKWAFLRKSPIPTPKMMEKERPLKASPSHTGWGGPRPEGYKVRYKERQEEKETRQKGEIPRTPLRVKWVEESGRVRERKGGVGI